MTMTHLRQENFLSEDTWLDVEAPNFLSEDVWKFLAPNKTVCLSKKDFLATLGPEKQYKIGFLCQEYNPILDKIDSFHVCYVKCKCETTDPYFSIATWPQTIQFRAIEKLSVEDCVKINSTPGVMIFKNSRRGDELFIQCDMNGYLNEYAVYEYTNAEYNYNINKGELYG